ELAAIHRSRLEPARRPRRRLEPALLADHPGTLSQLQPPPRAPSPPGHPVAASAAVRRPRRSAAVVLVDLPVAVWRRPPGAAGRTIHPRRAPMKALVVAIAFCLACGAGASAQTASEAADHDALRKLKDDIVNAINTRNLDVMDRVMNKPFM